MSASIALQSLVSICLLAFIAWLARDLWFPRIYWRCESTTGWNCIVESYAAALEVRHCDRAGASDGVELVHIACVFMTRHQFESLPEFAGP